MIEYIKIAVAALIGGIFAPLPASSSAHFAFLNSFMNISDESNMLGFYYSLISIVASVIMLSYVRKIYARAAKKVFASKSADNSKAYKTMIVNTIVSLIAAVIMFIPYSKGKLLLDVFPLNLTSNNILVSAFCCFACGFILIVAIWFSRQKNQNKHRAAKKYDIVRFTIYQIPANFLPGFSHIANGAVSLSVSNVEESVMMRELYLYVAPSMLVINVGRVISYIVRGGITFDPIMIAICVVFAAIGCAVMFPLISKVNIRKTFAFFSVYSIVFGIIMTVMSFISLN